MPTAAAPSPRSYTPPDLAARILGDRSLLEGERKQVTILFADLRGSTERVSELDPEDARRLLDPALEAMMESVHRFEGTVNRVQGDGLMAMFGAPLAHEDHALRACHAALAMRESIAALPSRLELRIGMHSGEVVVRAIHNDLSMSYDAVGLTAHLAARMEQLAAPGSVRMTADTLRLVDGYVRATPLGPTAVKGLDEPVEVFTLDETTGARTRLEASATGALTPFVGRARELATLESCLESASAGGGRVVLAAGEAGIGKSRLLLEFRRRVGHAATWLEGHALSFGQSMPFHPLIDLLRANFGIEEDDPERRIIEKIEDGVQGLDASLAPIVPYLRYLMAVDPGDAGVAGMDPQLRRAELFDALQRLLLRAAQERPQIVVIEDLHWIDPATEAVLSYIADSVPTSRVLCLFTYRPGYRQPFGDRTFHVHVNLSTLSSADTAAMAMGLLESRGLPVELERLIAAKAEGNPFYVEEVVRSLRESGALVADGDRLALARPVSEIVVPDTIHGVIMARIDRLDEAPRSTLQLASVIGREFTRRLIDRIGRAERDNSPHLQTLKAIELIYEKTRFPELAYMFKHALTQDVAYGSLLVERRRDLHGVIGRAIEDLYADRLTEHYEMLAHHYERAEQWDRALVWLQRAAEKASGAYANREALAFLDRALGAARMLGDAAGDAELAAIHKRRAALLFVQNEFERATTEGVEAARLAARAGDVAGEAGARADLAMVHLQGFHDFARSREEAERALALAERCGARSTAANALVTRSMMHGVTCHLEESLADIDRALREAQASGDPRTLSLTLGFAGIVRNWRGDLAEAEVLQARGVAIAREHRHVLSVLTGTWMHGLTLVGLGRHDEARAVLEENVALAGRIGEFIWRNRALNTLGWLHIECGDLERGRVRNEESAALARHHDFFEEAIANADLNVADIERLRGDLPAARDRLEAVHGIATNPKTSEWMRWRYSTHLFASLAEERLAEGDPAAAARHVEQCLELATRTSSRKYVARGRRLAGGVALAAGRYDDAEQACREALAIAARVGNPTEIWRARLGLGHALERLGRRDAAGEAFRAAREVVDAMRERTSDPELRASLAGSEVFTEVRALGAAR